MSGKRNSSRTANRLKSKRRPQLVRIYPSLSQHPTPAERRAELDKRMRARGITPIEDFDCYLLEVADFWPEDETCDEFIAWLRALRREGRS